MDSNKAPVSNAAKITHEHTVRVLSPTMLVIKRFVRNRLAIVGTIIIVAMFLFSFLGGVLMPYKETDTFYTTDLMVKDFASASYNRNFYYYTRGGAAFNTSAQAKFVLAATNGKDTFEAGGTDYVITKEGEDFYRIGVNAPVASAMALKGIYSVMPEDGVTLPEDFEDAFVAAHTAKAESFELDGVTYYIQNAGKTITITAAQDVALATKLIFTRYEEDDELYDTFRKAAQTLEKDGTYDIHTADRLWKVVIRGENATILDEKGKEYAKIPGFREDGSLPYEFRLQAQRAIEAGEKSFEAMDRTWTVDDDGDNVTILDDTGANYALATDIVITPAVSGTRLSMEFRDRVTEAIAEGIKEFQLTDEEGNPVTYTVVRRDYQFDIRTETVTKLIDTYAPPSREHILGTDGYGMDILTRLMYGGRVSLIIGFIVVIIETVLGVILGGISGYFGKWVDQIIMRLVDVFNCIPTMPLYIIIGAVMDSLRIDASARIMVMMAILGVTGWPGIARVVRGQILSLREQEFMLATEATGLSVSRRIFKHLVPNVIPQLIVYATMGLGGIILTEATLSFLGLGVKYPYASWGNIINAVNDVFVLTNYPYVWIPAGILILLTVLGFNFIGDGLRDAFDPKMKR